MVLANCLSVFDYFTGLVLKELSYARKNKNAFCKASFYRENYDKFLISSLH